MPDADPGSTQAVTNTRSSLDVLLPALADAVLTVPGVVRLEPTLSTSGPGVLLRQRLTDGIRLLDRAGTADVDINIATSAAYQARDVTHHVRSCVISLLPTHGYTPGSIAVSVLTISPPSPVSSIRTAA